MDVLHNNKQNAKTVFAPHLENASTHVITVRDLGPGLVLELGVRVRVSDSVYVVWCKNQGDSKLSQQACGLQMTEEDESLRDLSSFDDLTDK